MLVPVLQDSGGFQMVSLLELAEITEEGVRFKSPHDDSMMMLTPEHSMAIQNSIGSLIVCINSLYPSDAIWRRRLRSTLVQANGTNPLTLNVRGPSYLGLNRSISWLLMPWLLTSPGHRQP